MTWRRLKQVAAVRVSNVDKKTVEGEQPVRLCNYTDVYYHQLITANLPFMEATATGEQLTHFGLLRGDVLVTKDSETADDIAVPAYIAEDLPGVLSGYHLAILRPRPGTDGRYLFWALASRSSREQFSAAATGVTRFGLRYETFGAVRVPLPSLQRQQAVADYLDPETARIDALIDKKHRMVELLDERFLADVRLRVTGGMPLKDPLDVHGPEISRPEWEPVKLGSDLRFGSGTTPAAGEERYYHDGSVPWLVTGELRDKPVAGVAHTVTSAALADYTALRVHPGGALLVAMYGATVGRLGITTFPTAVNQACCVMHSGSRVRTWFLFYYLLSHRADLMERSVGAGQPNISQEILRSLRVPVPQVSEQDRIVEVLDAAKARVDRLVAPIQDQLALLHERRQALITAAVTGELDIPGMAA